MTGLVVVGAQWGDEGKGRLGELLAKKADLFVHYAGGGNPGQTMVVGGERLVFEVLPPSAMREKKNVLLAQGMALDPRLVTAELARLEEHGVTGGKVHVCRRAHVILPHHILIDELRHEAEGASGVPRRGIGPAYADKLARRGVQMGDLLDEERLEERVKASLDGVASLILSLGGEVPSAAGIVEELRAHGDRLAPHFVDGSRHCRDALAAEQTVVFEAPLGTMVDLELGAYPFVVSASTIASGVGPGVGLPPSAVTRVVGIAKAYSTRAGRGPFPAELTGDLADRLVKQGQEFGEAGRPRRVGMLDLTALRYAARVNGFEQLVLTKLDVLAGLDEIPVCVGYELDGEVLDEPPFAGLSRATAKVEMLPGFGEGVADCRIWDELPESARNLVALVEKECGVRVAMIGVGPDSGSTIVREEIL